MQTIINPLVVSVGPTNEATITPVPMTHHGGGVKKVIAVVAAVAIPIAAPAIASSIAASSLVSASVAAAMTTTAGAVVSSAIVGAGLGAITAKVTGGDVKAGAITGLIGGGIGGYTSATKPGMFGNPTTTNVANQSQTFSGNAVRAPGADGSVVPVSDTSTALSNTANQGQVVPASFAGSSKVAAEAALSNQVIEPTNFVASMKKGLSSAGELVMDRLTNPEVLANAALQVGGAVAAEAIVGTPAQTPEEQAAIEQYKAELQTLKARDEEAFNQKLDAAKQYMVQAGYYDPNYFALQSANKQAISEARKLREFERKAGLTMGGVSQGDRRRAALAGGANIQSAFDRGFLTGTDLQNRAMSTGVGLIPNAPTSGLTGAYNMAVLAQNEGAAERAAADRKKDNIQKFFGAFSVNRGKTDAEKKRDKELAAGLNTGSMPKLDQKKNIPGVITPEMMEENRKKSKQSFA